VAPGEKFADIPTAKYPAKAHTWAGISASGKGKLYLFTRNMDADFYECIIEDYVVPSLQALNVGHRRRLVIQQDNDTKHNSTQRLVALRRARIAWVPQPPQSPDLNHTEHVWKLMKDRVAAPGPETVADLRRWIVFEWDHLNNEDFCPAVFYIPIASKPSSRREAM